MLDRRVGLFLFIANVFCAALNMAFFVAEGHVLNLVVGCFNTFVAAFLYVGTFTDG